MADAFRSAPQARLGEAVDMVAKARGLNVGAAHALSKGRSDWLDQQVSKAVLGRPASSDALTGGLGSGREHRQVQEDIERADAKALAAILNRDLIRPWVMLNHGPRASWPRLPKDRPEREDLKASSKAVAPLIDRGLAISQEDIRVRLNRAEPRPDALLMVPNRKNSTPSAPPAGDAPGPAPHDCEIKRNPGEIERVQPLPGTRGRPEHGRGLHGPEIAACGRGACRRAAGGRGDAGARRLAGRVPRDGPGGVPETDADGLAEVIAQAVDNAVTQGTGQEAFRKEFRAAVAKNGWPGTAGLWSRADEAWCTRVIYRTNMATTHAAGRRAQLIAGGFRFRVYFHGGSREPRLQHLAWNGVALPPPDHPFGATHGPPNGWDCSCYVSGARTPAGIWRLGGDPDKPLPPGWDAPDPKTGVPRGIDKGRAHAPGASNSELISGGARQIARLPFELGSRLARSLEPQVARAWPDWVRSVREGLAHEPGLVGAVDAEVTAALAARGVPPRSAEILVRAGLINGPKARRHEASGDALTAADWETLPLALRGRIAVLRPTGQADGQAGLRPRRRGLRAATGDRHGLRPAG